MVVLLSIMIHPAFALEQDQSAKIFGPKHRELYTRELTEEERKNITGAIHPVIIAVGWAAGAGGASIVYQYAANGQVDWWEVATNATGAFVGALTGGALTPYIGQVGSAVVGGAAGMISYYGMNNHMNIGSVCSTCHQ
jgi:hypothetical protein